MLKNVARKFTLALTLVVLTASASKAIAQSTTSTPPTSSPSIVTGTDPGPDYVGIMLAVLHLA
jgi:hypothetical protein